jgi:hypothetical protein
MLLLLLLLLRRQRALCEERKFIGGKHERSKKAKVHGKRAKRWPHSHIHQGKNARHLKQCSWQVGAEEGAKLNVPYESQDFLAEYFVLDVMKGQSKGTRRC